MSSLDLFAAASRTTDPESRSRLVFAGRRAALIEEIRGCARCDLRWGCTAPVPFSGGPGRVVFVGEAPGAEEDRRGVPFVGRSGEFLAAIVAERLSLQPGEYTLCNTVCCRPPLNDYMRAIQVDAPARCREFMARSLDLSGAWVAVALGGRAHSALDPGSSSTVAQARQRPFWRDGRLVFTTYHPAYALRNPDGRRLIAEDLDRVRRALDAAGGPLPEPTEVPQVRAFTDEERREYRKRLDGRPGWFMVWSAVLGEQIVVARPGVRSEEFAELPHWSPGELARIDALARCGEFTWPKLRAVAQVKREFAGEVVA